MDIIPTVKIQMLSRGLADLCISEADNYHNYTEEDLFNATLIFSHFIMDVSYTNNVNLLDKEKMDKAEKIGKAIRELIQEATGKDMHVIADKIIKSK